MNKWITKKEDSTSIYVSVNFRYLPEGRGRPHGFVEQPKKGKTSQRHGFIVWVMSSSVGSVVKDCRRTEERALCVHSRCRRRLAGEEDLINGGGVRQLQWGEKEEDGGVLFSFSSFLFYCFSFPFNEYIHYNLI